jgi:hypothetical protein
MLEVAYFTEELECTTWHMEEGDLALLPPDVWDESDIPEGKELDWEALDQLNLPEEILSLPVRVEFSHGLPKARISTLREQIRAMA